MGLRVQSLIVILVLFLIFGLIFSSLSYFHYKTFFSKIKDDMSIIIKKNHDSNIKEIKNFFTSRAQNILNFNHIKFHLSNKDEISLFESSKSFWEVLNKENSEILQMNYYDNSLNPIVSMSKFDKPGKLKIQNLNQVSYGFCKNKNGLTYNVIVPAFEYNEVVGYLEFVISGKVFLDNLNLTEQITTNFISDENLKTALSSQKNGKFLIDFKFENEFIIQDKPFLIYKFDILNKNGEKITNLVAYEDISRYTKGLIDMIIMTLIATFVFCIFITIYYNSIFSRLLKSKNEAENLAQKSKKELQNAIKDYDIIMKQNSLDIDELREDNIILRKSLIEILQSEILEKYGNLLDKSEVFEDILQQVIRICLDSHQNIEISHKISDRSNAKIKNKDMIFTLLHCIISGIANTKNSAKLDIQIYIEDENFCIDIDEYNQNLEAAINQNIAKSDMLKNEILNYRLFLAKYMLLENELGTILLQKNNNNKITYKTILKKSKIVDI